MAGKPRLLLVDGNSLLHRAFHALPPLMTSDGRPTNAVYGLATMLVSLLAQHPPDAAVVAFDSAGPTLRHQEFAEYKATRKEAPEDLAPQFPLARRLVQALGLALVEVPGWEADDLLSSLARQAERAGYAVTIVTGDRDMVQLVTEDTHVLANLRGVADMKEYDRTQVQADYGLAPAQIADLKGLAGDTSDNIPGVPGIGPKTATKLLQEFGTVENLLARLDEVTPARTQALLSEHADQALLSKRLATLTGEEAPIVFNPEAFRYAGWNLGELRSFLLEMEFSKLLQRLEAQTERAAEPPEAALAPSTEVVASDPEAVLNRARRLGYLYLAPAFEAGELTGLALSDGTDVAYVSLPVAGTGPSLFADSPASFDLSPPLADSTLGKRGADLKGIDQALRSRGMALAGYQFDAALADYLLASHRKDHTLDKLTAEYLGEHLPPVGTAGRPLQEAALLPRLERALRARLRDLALEPLLDDLELPLAAILSDMESAGIAVDAAALRRLDDFFAQELRRLGERICELAGGDCNPDSPQQVGQVLFERLGLPGGKRTKTGWATGAEVLEELALEHEIAALILQNREYSKLRSTYVKGLLAQIDPRTGRVHTTFEQTVTATGRLSSRNPNLQNIPIRTDLGREIRACFVAGSPDTVLVSADYSQIELRLLAHFSGVPRLVEAFASGHDVHTATAALIFGLPEDQVDSPQRRIAKTINYAVIYGMGPQALARQIGVTRAEASAFIASYFERLGGVKEYMDTVVRAAKEQGYVETLTGRRRYLPELSSPNSGLRSYAERAAANAPLQGSAADLMKIAMVNLAPRLPRLSPTARLLLQVHDELVLEVPRHDLEAVASTVKEIMEGAWNLTVPLEAEVKSGANWRDVVKLL